MEPEGSGGLGCLDGDIPLLEGLDESGLAGLVGVDQRRHQPGLEAAGRLLDAFHLMDHFIGGELASPAVQPDHGDLDARQLLLRDRREGADAEGVAGRVPHQVVEALQPLLLAALAQELDRIVGKRHLRRVEVDGHDRHVRELLDRLPQVGFPFGIEETGDAVLDGLDIGRQQADRRKKNVHFGFLQWVWNRGLSTSSCIRLRMPPPRACARSTTRATSSRSLNVTSRPVEYRASCSARFFRRRPESEASRDWNSAMPEKARPSGIAPEASTGGPSLNPMPIMGSIAPRGAGSPLPIERYRERWPPITSNASRAKPGGSIFEWQEPQPGKERCFSSCSRMVTAPRTSGSTAGTLGGGGSGGWPRRRAMTKAPRGTGEVVVPFAVILRMAPWVRKGPRGQSGGRETRRMEVPFTPGMP